MKPRAIALAAVVAALWAAAAWADPQGPSVGPLPDPWVPPQSRAKQPGQETRGEALRGQVERKLREKFTAADTEGRGSITREQARAANLGIVADNFDAMDEARSGRVSFDDLKRFLRARGARTL